MTMRNRLTLVAATAAGIFLAVGENRAATAGDPLAHLAGRWIGEATMTPTSGPKSHFKCIVTYLPRSDGPGLKQNLRCQDETNFKLHAATELTVDGETVSGRWQDKINEIEGTVAGAVTPNGFEIELKGRFFAARMAVAGEGCDQTVRVLPSRSDVFRELAATLKKC